MSALGEDLHMIGVLWKRDVVLFLRQRSRIAGTLAQPLLFWLAIGSGLAPTFRMGSGQVGYMAYFFPGIVVMLVLLSAISATMSVIEDRHQGFLQGVLVAPGSSAALVLGKSLGSASVALVQAALLLALAPFAGYPPRSIAWGWLAVVLGLAALGLTATGFALAWWIDSTQGYHVVMSVVLIPLWVLSGAVFPAEGAHPAMRALVKFNPMSYAVAGVRRALHGGSLPPGAGLPGSSPYVEIAVLLALVTASVVAAATVVSRRRQF